MRRFTFAQGLKLVRVGELQARIEPDAGFSYGRPGSRNGSRIIRCPKGIYATSPHGPNRRILGAVNRILRRWGDSWPNSQPLTTESGYGLTTSSEEGCLTRIRGIERGRSFSASLARGTDA
jgi:hypothetical protein